MRLGSIRAKNACAPLNELNYETKKLNYEAKKPKYEAKKRNYALNNHFRTRAALKKLFRASFLH